MKNDLIRDVKLDFNTRKSEKKGGWINKDTTREKQITLSI